MLLVAEYFKNDYSGVTLSDDSDPLISAWRLWYAGMLVMLTGEQPELTRGCARKNPAAT